MMVVPQGSDRLILSELVDRTNDIGVVLLDLEFFFLFLWPTLMSDGAIEE